MISFRRIIWLSLSILLFAIGCDTARATSTSTPAPGGGTYLDFPIPKPILEIPLFDSKGSKFSLGDYKGKWLVLSDFLTSCQEVCPMTSANMQKIANRFLSKKISDQIKVLELSVDGWRDNPARLKAYQGLFDDNSWVLGSSTVKYLDTFWQFFGIGIEKSNYSKSELKNLPADWKSGKVQTFDITHADAVLLISPNQHWKWLDLGTPKTDDKKIPETLKKVLTNDGIQNLNKPEEPTWSTSAVYSAVSHYLNVAL